MAEKEKAKKREKDKRFQQFHWQYQFCCGVDVPICQLIRTECQQYYGIVELIKRFVRLLLKSVPNKKYCFI